jgi:hypothetical protein
MAENTNGAQLRPVAGELIWNIVDSATRDLPRWVAKHCRRRPTASDLRQRRRGVPPIAAGSGKQSYWKYANRDLWEELQGTIDALEQRNVRSPSGYPRPVAGPEDSLGTSERSRPRQGRRRGWWMLPKYGYSARCMVFVRSNNASEPFRTSLDTVQLHWLM